jgi:hypothetical protein
MFVNYLHNFLYYFVVQIVALKKIISVFAELLRRFPELIDTMPEAY